MRILLASAKLLLLTLLLMGQSPHNPEACNRVGGFTSDGERIHACTCERHGKADDEGMRTDDGRQGVPRMVPDPHFAVVQ